MDDRKRYQCSDGPFDREYLWLCTRSTAVFTLGPWRGRYVADKQNKYLFWEWF